jgi:hypothetical protein
MTALCCSTIEIGGNSEDLDMTVEPAAQEAEARCPLGKIMGCGS